MFCLSTRNSGKFQKYFLPPKFSKSLRELDALFLARTALHGILQYNITRERMSEMNLRQQLKFNARGFLAAAKPSPFLVGLCALAINLVLNILDGEITHAQGHDLSVAQLLHSASSFAIFRNFSRMRDLNFSGSSPMGPWAECSNQTRSLSGASMES